MIFVIEYFSMKFVNQMFIKYHESEEVFEKNTENLTFSNTIITKIIMNLVYKI